MKRSHFIRPRADITKMSTNNHHSLPSCVPLPVPPERLSEVVGEAKEQACLNGCLMRTKEHPSTSDLVTPAPFMLIPTSIPGELFKRVKDIQPYISELYFKVANDYEFLRKSLERTIAVDEYTAKQWAIMEEARKSGRTKSIQVGLLRSDYMMDTSRGAELSLSQVEVNTISSSFGGLASRLAKVHRFIIGQLGEASDVSKVPLNAACTGYAEAVHTAWKLYGNPEAVVVVFIHAPEQNTLDQQWFGSELRDIEPTIRIRLRTMEYVGSNGSLSEDNKFILDNEEVAVFYYRTGYTLETFKSETAWKAKLLAELSTAAVCPSIGWHLAGTKKVQQELARPGVLEKFISDPEKVALVRSTFTGLYSLEQGPESENAAARAIANPEKFVMKPQLEGGGNNIYGDDIRTTLEEIGEERSKFILMDRILPLSTKNHIIRSGYSFEEAADCVSEFGIFGSFVSHNGSIVRNKTDGHLVRTKPQNLDEGGVSVGVSCLNSPFLV